MSIGSSGMDKGKWECDREQVRTVIIGLRTSEGLLFSVLVRPSRRLLVRGQCAQWWVSRLRHVFRSHGHDLSAPVILFCDMFHRIRSLSLGSARSAHWCFVYIEGGSITMVGAELSNMYKPISSSSYLACNGCQWTIVMGDVRRRLDGFVLSRGRSSAVRC